MSIEDVDRVNRLAADGVRFTAAYVTPQCTPTRATEPGLYLVTLTGPGGVGKTRLALEVARRASDGYELGACFIELTPVENPAAVVMPSGIDVSVAAAITTPSTNVCTASPMMTSGTVLR